MVTFICHRRSDGLFVNPYVLYDGPLVPGTLLTWVPIVSGVDVRLGVVVALVDDVVMVVWNRWAQGPGIQHRELERRLGIVPRRRVQARAPKA